MKSKIIIRADGGSAIGMGHIVRCIALADMLKNDFTISFAVQNPSESILKTISSLTTNIIQLPETNDFELDLSNFVAHLKEDDIVILDGYNFRTKYQEKIKNKGCRLVCIDDLHTWHHVADVIINHAEGLDKSAYSTEPNTKIYLGLNYVLLREPFLKRSNNKQITSVKKIFISMGAADFDNNTYKYTKALISFGEIEEIHLMLSSINSHIYKIKQLIQNNTKIHTHFNISAEELAILLSKCDLAICPASSISLECCSIGIGIISGYTADNQLDQLKGLDKKNVLINSKNMNTQTHEQIQKQIREVILQPSLLNEMLQHQNELIDGKSPVRLKSVFYHLSSLPIHFRFAKEEDVDLYFSWVNDENVRKNSFNQNPILYKEHVKWFHSRINNKNYSFYLFFDRDEQPIGQVRIEKTGNENTVDISIDKNFRGKSFGSEILNIACTDYLEKFPNEQIYSYIKKENKSSYSIFKKVNFVDLEEGTLDRMDVFKLCRKKNS